LVSGNSAGLYDTLQPSCSSGVGGEDAVYTWEAPANGAYSFSTAGSDYDTVLYVTEGCSGAELECNDEDTSGTGTSSLEDITFSAGTVVTIVIDSADGTSGNYILDITSSTELSCDDGTDDDGDGLIDCDDDDCLMASVCASSSCPNFDLGTLSGESVATGDNLSTTGADDYEGSYLTDSCGSSSSSAVDYSYLWEAPGSGCAVFDTSESTYDTVLRLYDECSGSELSCDDDGSVGTRSELSYAVEAGEEYLVIVDGYSSFSTGSYVLDIAFSEGVDCNGGEFACDDGTDNDGDGDIDCDDADCASLQACNESSCDDGLDNEGDGLIDCDDPDCASDAFCYETDCTDGLDNEYNGVGDGLVDCDDDDCEMDLSCYESSCDDGIDNDSNGLFDCDDPGCDGNVACIEQICDDGSDDDGDGDVDCADDDCFDFLACIDYCANTDIASATGTGVATGTNAGLGDNFAPSCSAGSGGEEDIVSWTSPASGTYSFSTANSDYDTIMYMYDSCVGSETECNDDEDFGSGVTTSAIENVFVAQGEEIFIVIDGYDSSSFGNYSLDIISTFEPDCTDGQDNDNDGLTDCDDSDCDFDSSCASTTCPNFDLGDITGDGLVTGDLANAMQDQFAATCSSQNSNDLTFAWEASESGCVTVDTLSGVMDSILVVFDDCPSNGGVELACNDDHSLSTGVYESQLTFDATAGSQYIIGVDAWSYAISSTYILDINIDPNVSCP
jgi:hypothetical protein